MGREEEPEIIWEFERTGGRVIVNRNGVLVATNSFKEVFDVAVKIMYGEIDRFLKMITSGE